MSSYYKFLFEEKKEFSKETYKDYPFEQLSTQKQVDYIDYFCQEFNIPAKTRPSDTRYRRIIIELQSEDMLDFAVKKFAITTGMEPQGYNFTSHDWTFTWTYNYDYRRPLNAQGDWQEDDEGSMNRFANNVRKSFQLGKRMAHSMFKPNLKTLNPEF